MKKLNLSVCIAISIIVTIFVIGCDSQKKTNEITIGVNLPLTGKLAFYGNEVKNALSIVEKEKANSSIKFIFEDNQSEASNSVTIFNKFANDSSIPLIISCNSPLSIPLRPLAEKNEIVLLALVTGARNFGEANKWSFRDAINQDQEGVAIANYIINHTELQEGATFVVNDDYGLGGAESFMQKFEQLGGKIVAQETFEMEGRNMRNDVSKLISTNPEFIFLVGREQTIISSINQIREQDKDIPIFTSDSFDSPNVQEGLGKNSIGVIYANYNNKMDTEEGEFLISEYKRLYDKKPGIYAVDSFIAGKYIFDLLGKAGNNSSKLQQEFSKMSYNSQIKGTLHVNDMRDVVSPIAIFKVNNDLEKEIIFVVE